VARQRAQDFGQLQSDEDEHEAVQEKFHHLPDWPAAQTRLEGEEFGHPSKAQGPLRGLLTFDAALGFRKQCP
jgi:hypothetical protein